MLTPGESYELTGSVVVYTTRDAVKVRTADDENYWVPRSCCIDGDDLEQGDEDISVLAWWAEREGIC